MLTTIHGDCEAVFASVGEVFAENFRSRGEVGAAVCVYKDGKKVVDLWGGITDPQSGKPWVEDTLVSMM